MQDISDQPGGTITSRITRILADRIVAGALPPGERLRQDHIAAEFGTSHVPVREAFRRLEARGLVISEPRRGVRVAGLDPLAVREVTGMRAALESLALRHAIPQMTPDILAAAGQALQDGEASADIAVWEAANRRFHRTLLAPCRMPRLLSAIDDLHAASSRFLLATWQAADWQPRSDSEHAAILAAAASGAADRAAGLLADHILAAGEALIAMLERRTGGGGGGGRETDTTDT